MRVKTGNQILSTQSGTLGLHSGPTGSALWHGRGKIECR